MATTATARVLKNEVFHLRGGWHLVWNGHVPVTAWADKGGALAQLELLCSGYTRMCDDGSLRHIGAATVKVVWR